jgi:pimeloyl-ACP methyl ester carboxylesterase
MNGSTQGEQRMFFDLEDGSLYYEIRGEGETIVLSHAAFLDSRMFDAQWERLTQNYRVIRYDMRGYGKSSPVTGPVSRRNDLAQLLDHLAITQAHLVGCSNGGEIMLDVALEYPQLALSLTMVCSTPSGFEMKGEAPRYMFEMFDAIQSGDVDGASELQLRIWLDGMYREPEGVDVGLREKAGMMNRIPVERNTFLIADTQSINRLNPPAVSRLQEVSCPVLIVVGSLDHPEILRAADTMAASIPNAKKRVIEGSGHVPSFEQPEVFNRMLLEFLEAKRG